MTQPNRISELDLSDLEKTLTKQPEQMTQAPFLYQICLKLTRALIQLESDFERVSERRNGQIETIFKQLREAKEVNGYFIVHQEENKMDHEKFCSWFDRIFARLGELEKALEQNKRVIKSSNEKLNAHEDMDVTAHGELNDKLYTLKETLNSERHTYGKSFKSIFEQLDEFAKELSEIKERPDNQQFQLEAEGWELIAIIPYPIDLNTFSKICGCLDDKTAMIETNEFGKIGLFRKAVINV